MGKVVKGVVNVILFMYMFMAVHLVNAGPLEDYEEAKEIYIASIACMAAYSDRTGSIAMDMLVLDGWQVDAFVQTSSNADARFLLAQKQAPGMKEPIYLLAAVGTENIKDVKTDLMFHKVYFNGRTLDEFAAYSDKKGIPDSMPKVHGGFHQYVQAALSAEINDGGKRRRLTEMLLENKQRKVFLAGHSLGGAAVTLGGARLLSMGVSPEQIEIITFGAPAVGNAAFRKQFENKLNLTRIVTGGDPITSALQKLVGGYEQFGREIRWSPAENTALNPHQISMYLDLAVKNYYQARQKAVDANAINIPNKTKHIAGVPRFYVAPVINNIPKELQTEYSYMKELLFDEYRRILPGYLLGETKGSTYDNALATGCNWIIFPEITVQPVRNEKNRYYITLQQIIYRLDNGQMVKAESYTSATRSFAPVGAFLHDVKSMSADSPEWIRNSF